MKLLHAVFGHKYVVHTLKRASATFNGEVRYICHCGKSKKITVEK